MKRHRTGCRELIKITNYDFHNLYVASNFLTRFSLITYRCIRVCLCGVSFYRDFKTFLHRRDDTMDLPTGNSREILLLRREVFLPLCLCNFNVGVAFQVSSRREERRLCIETMENVSSYSNCSVF